ncbi:hypothetical protein C9374_010053 [Naegleria lovaniensis]|uniref:Uncharacterized protein n=1 Tax=Naegleria lovaniensis TaxID=51637 RepID=A0AA88KG55_NAELO|nr:uncharacterized protein C9374_010053 [Naegleria lovaniensis]KAG2375049.1 hypothetical protein C9374_010053 [Naegleria lovaniensis]
MKPLVLSNILSQISSSATTIHNDEEDDDHTHKNEINQQFIEEIFESGERSQRQLKEWIKGVYELEKSGKDSLMVQSSGMNKLLVEGFDEEQIWSQLETFHKPLLKQLSNNIENKLPSLESIVPEHVLEYLLEDDDDEDENDDQEIDERALRRAMTNDEDDDEDEEDENNFENADEEDDDHFRSSKKRTQPSSVDDARNYIADKSEAETEEDINKFLELMEQDMDKLDEMDYDMNEQIVNNKELRKAFGELYGDEEEEDDDDEEEDKNTEDMNGTHKTPFELEQERLLAKMEELEGRHIADKDWQEIGEVDAKKRPKNSLVEEGKLTFEHAHKAKPVITEEVTRDLESIIISRIVSGIFDDPVKPEESDKNEDLKQDVQLEHEKSKKSLAQIYEEMYLKKVEGVDIEEEKKEDPVVKATKQKILKQVSDLLQVLNQMSTFTYVAPPRIDLEDESELKSVTNLVTGKEEGEKSAHEILPAVKWLPQANEEMSEQDKKRKRRQVKELASKKSKKAQELIEKLNPGASAHASKLMDDIEKKKENAKKEKATKLEDASAVGSDKMFGSSKQFFNKIQENIRKVHGAREAKKEKSGLVSRSTSNNDTNNE